MRKIFIADAHLRQPEDRNYQMLLCFLSTLPGSADTLYILGDLFDFWIGYPRLVFPYYREMLDQLAMLRDAGISIVYFEGNHDFHMGPIFTKELGITVYSGPASLEIDGRRCLVCHGDEMNRDDRGYLLLRSILHSQLTNQLIKIVPASCTLRIAEFLDRRCGAPTVAAAHPDPRPVIRRYGAEQFSRGIDLVISGHFHTPFVESQEGKTILSLGDWISQFSYAECSEGVFSLHVFSG